MPVNKFANNTTVRIEQTRGNIAADMGRFGGHLENINDDIPGRAIILWQSNHATPQWLRTVLLYPIVGPNSEQIQKRKWRALAYKLKHDLVAVDEGIVTFEQAFYTWIIGTDGKTNFERDEERGVLPKPRKTLRLQAAVT
jgi:hypothetical protein